MRDEDSLSFQAGMEPGRVPYVTPLNLQLLARSRSTSLRKRHRKVLDDYIWWRGNGSPENQYVAVTFRSDDGAAFTISRSSGLWRGHGLQQNSGSTMQGFGTGECSKPTYANHHY